MFNVLVVTIEQTRPTHALPHADYGEGAGSDTLLANSSSLHPVERAGLNVEDLDGHDRHHRLSQSKFEGLVPSRVKSIVHHAPCLRTLTVLGRPVNTNFYLRVDNLPLHIKYA